MNNNFKLDMSYITGLFDAKGIVHYKQIKKVWKIKMELSMPDKNVMELFHETLSCGTLREKKVVAGGKKQWRWQCSNRDCFFVASLLWPHTIIKLHQIEQIVDHYGPDIQEIDDNVIDLALERKKRNDR